MPGETYEMIARGISAIGFPIAIAIYLLVTLPKNLEMLSKVQSENNQKMDQIVNTLGGLRTDIQQLIALLSYAERGRRLGSEDTR